MPAGARLIHKSLSHSRSYGRLSLKGKVLWPLLFANGDDQGRLSAETDEIKWLVCPNVEEITKEEIPALLEEMRKEAMIVIFSAASISVLQMLHWWQRQHPQWASPSKYPAPNGWKDHHRYKSGGKVVTLNWPPEDVPSVTGEATGEGIGEATGELSGEAHPNTHPQEKREGGDLLSLYEKNIGPLAPLLREQVTAAILKYPPVWIEDAIKEAVRAGVKNWRYVSSILEAWETKGTTLAPDPKGRASKSQATREERRARKE